MLKNIMKSNCLLDTTLNNIKPVPHQRDTGVWGVGEFMIRR